MSEKNQQAENTSPKRRTVLYSIVRAIAFICFHTIFPVVYHGREKLRQTGPYILIQRLSDQPGSDLSGQKGAREKSADQLDFPCSPHDSH